MSQSPAKRPGGRRAAAPTGAATSGASSVTVSVIEKTLGIGLADARQRYALLTERERQVAGMMAIGKPNRQIAEELGISPKTLDIHRANLMHKLEARTTARVANIINLILLAGSAG
jgi:FixJ family two-component response regulator